MRTLRRPTRTRKRRRAKAGGERLAVRRAHTRVALWMRSTRGVSRVEGNTAFVITFPSATVDPCDFLNVKAIGGNGTVGLPPFAPADVHAREFRLETQKRRPTPFGGHADAKVVFATSDPGHRNYVSGMAVRERCRASGRHGRSASRLSSRSRRAPARSRGSRRPRRRVRRSGARSACANRCPLGLSVPRADRHSPRAWLASAAPHDEAGGDIIAA